MDLMKMMRQAQELQAKMQAVQEELEAVTVEGVAGAGMVRVTLTAKGDLRGVSIDPSMLAVSEKEILEDLLVAAHADARKKAQAASEERMKSLTAGLPLPPGFKMPF